MDSPRGVTNSSRIKTVMELKPAWLWRSLCLMMIISKEAFIDTPHYDTARVAAQVVAVSALSVGDHLHAWKTREWTDHRFRDLNTAGIGLQIGGWFWFWFLLRHDYCHRPKIGLFNQSCRETTSSKYLLWNSRPNNSSRFIITATSKTTDRLSRRRELDGEKYELVIRIHNDEETYRELENYIRERKSWSLNAWNPVPKDAN